MARRSRGHSDDDIPTISKRANTELEYCLQVTIRLLISPIAEYACCGDPLKDMYYLYV